MARGKKPLNPIQVNALDAVRAIDAEWRTEKAAGWLEAKRALDRKIAALAVRREAAVIRAVQVGVPKVVISGEGLQASPNSVYDILKAHAGEMGIADQLAPVARYTLGEVYMPPGQPNTRYLNAVVWVIARDNPELVTTAPIGEGVTHPGQRYAVTRTGELDAANPTIQIVPTVSENDGELRDLLEEFGKSMARRYKYLDSETGKPHMTDTVQNTVQNTVQVNSGSLYPTPEGGETWTQGEAEPKPAGDDWTFVPPAGWDENYAGSMDDIE